MPTSTEPSAPTASRTGTDARSTGFGSTFTIRLPRAAEPAPEPAAAPASAGAPDQHVRGIA